MENSKIYTFLDREKIFCIRLLDGQKLIYNLAMQQPVKRFAFIRSALLSSIPLVSLLKGGENFGFYIDADRPEFNLKIEIKNDGKTRATINRESIKPNAKINGILRIIKYMPFQKDYYSSNILIENLTYFEVVNQALIQSFQFETELLLSPYADQSFLISKLPLSKTEAATMDLPSVSNWVSKNKKWLLDLTKNPPTVDITVTKFTKKGFNLLTSRPVELKCDCSIDKIIAALAPIYRKKPKNKLFKGQYPLNVNCEYCTKNYQITEDSLKKFAYPA